MNKSEGPLRGTGVGFHQVEGSYQQKGEDVTALRKHASMMKSVGAEILRKYGSIYPEKQAGVANPNAVAALANRDNKIFLHTRGGTAVQFLNESNDPDTQKTVNLCRNIQKSFAETFGRINELEYLDNPNVPGSTIIPIDNLHVTAIAMGVVDAKDETEFETRLKINAMYRACFKYLEQNASKEIFEINQPPYQVSADGLLAAVGSYSGPDPDQILETILSPEISADIRKLMATEKEELSMKLASFIESGGAIFNVVELKVTDNGSIVLQMAPNNDLVQIKQGLVPLGGIAKASLGNMTASTIGYLPNFHNISDEDKEAMKKLVSDYNQIIQQGYSIRMDRLDFVNFKVNTLSSDMIQKRPIHSQSSLSHMHFTYLT